MIIPVAAAVDHDQYSISSARKSPDIATGKVFVELVRTKANMYSLNADKNMRKNVATSPGITFGRITRQNALNSEHPSIIAASSKSVGTAIKNPLNIQIANVSSNEV